MPDPSAGATPVVEGATPSQTPEAPAPATPQTDPPPATDEDALGDAGKRALTAERSRASAAERERDELRKQLDEITNANRSEAEKAIDKARKEGAAEALVIADAKVRRAEVRTALLAAGVNPGLLDLAARADVFAELKVSDAGEVEGLTNAIKAFKESTPDLFPTQRPPDYGGGPRGSAANAGVDMNRLIREKAGRA